MTYDDFFRRKLINPARYDMYTNKLLNLSKNKSALDIEEDMKKAKTFKKAFKKVYRQKRKEELSIIITDFEYNAPNQYIKQPKNLYYLPTATNYNDIKRAADSFMRSMTHNDPNIRKKLLF